MEHIERFEWLLLEGRELLIQSSSDACSQPGLSSWQRALLKEQLNFQKRARRRFPDPENWIWTDKSLSQASDWKSAWYKASLFPKSNEVWDICCGAGVDSIALAQSTMNSVTSVDMDAAMTRLAASNALAHQVNLIARTEAFDPAVLPQSAWLHVDPDRRPAEHKTLRSELFSPPIAEVLRACVAAEGAQVKVAPSTRFEDADQQLIESQASRTWIGSMGECRQQLLSFGGLVPNGVEASQRHVVLLEGEVQAEFVGSASEEPNIVDSPLSFVFDLHPALRAAGLEASWADQNGLKALSSGQGYYTAETALEESKPWCSCFEFVAELPMDDRKVRKWLNQNKIGPVEVKTRGVQVDALNCQKRYSKPDGRPITMLVLRLGRKTRAIMATRY